MDPIFHMTPCFENNWDPNDNRYNSQQAICVRFPITGTLFRENLIRLTLTWNWRCIVYKLILTVAVCICLVKIRLQIYKTVKRLVLVFSLPV